MPTIHKPLRIVAVFACALSLHARTPEAARWYALANEIRERSLGPALPEVQTCEREIADSASRVRAAQSPEDRAREEAALQVWRQRLAIGLKALAGVSARQAALFAQLRQSAIPGFIDHCDYYAGRIAGHDWRRLNVELEIQLSEAARQSLRAEEAFLRSAIARLENARLLNELRPQTQSVRRWQERLAANERAREQRRGVWHYEGKTPRQDVLMNHKQCLQFLAEVTAANLRIAAYDLDWDGRSRAGRTLERLQQSAQDIQRELRSIVAELNASREAQQALLYSQAAALASEAGFLEHLLNDPTHPLTVKAHRAVEKDLRDTHRRRDGILAEVNRLKTSAWKVDDPPRH
ncbi:MAG: hypothetical protein ACI8W8_004525 [Rhodothermales bacterium]|jgi:hypothetical protein